MQDACLVGRDHVNWEPTVDHILYAVRKATYRVEYSCSFRQALILYHFNSRAAAYRIGAVFKRLYAPNIKSYRRIEL